MERIFCRRFLPLISLQFIRVFGHPWVVGQQNWKERGIVNFSFSVLLLLPSFLNSPTHLRNVRDCMLLHRRRKPAPPQILRARTADLLKVPALAAHPLLGLFYVGFVGPLVDLKSLIFLTKQFVPLEQVYSNYRGCGRRSNKNLLPSSPAPSAMALLGVT